MNKPAIAPHASNERGAVANHQLHNRFKLSHLHPRRGPEVKRSSFQMLRLPGSANVPIMGFRAIRTQDVYRLIPTGFSDGFKGVTQGR